MGKGGERRDGRKGMRGGKKRKGLIIIKIIIPR